MKLLCGLVVLLCIFAMSIQGNPGYVSTNIQPTVQSNPPIGMAGYPGYNAYPGFGYGGYGIGPGFGPWDYDYGFDDYAYINRPRRHYNHHHSNGNQNNNNGNGNNNNNCNNGNTDPDLDPDNGNNNNTVPDNSTDPNLPIDPPSPELPVDLPAQPGNNISPSKCRIAGEYRHLCLKNNVFDPRELNQQYQLHYGCFIDAICGYKDGQCQWFKSRRFDRCILQLAAKNSKNAKIKPVSNAIVSPVYDYKPSHPYQSPSTPIPSVIPQPIPSTPVTAVPITQNVITPIPIVNPTPTPIPIQMAIPIPFQIIPPPPTMINTNNALNADAIGRAITETTQRLMPTQLRFNLH